MPLGARPACSLTAVHLACQGLLSGESDMAGSILLGMLIKSITSVFTTASRERTKREIAAYVAEGSMTPEQAERILKAGDRAAA